MKQLGKSVEAREAQQTTAAGGINRQNVSFTSSSSPPSLHLDTTSQQLSFPLTSNRHHESRSYNDHVRFLLQLKLVTLLMTPAVSTTAKAVAMETTRKLLVVSSLDIV